MGPMAGQKGPNVSRYSWASGPSLISRFERTEFHAGRGVLEPKGRQIRMIVGQVRDNELNLLLNWAIEAPANPVNARIELRDHADRIPRAPDWSPRLRSGAASGIPKGYTLPKSGSPFERGLIL